MISLAKVAANRRNAEKSTGPRTAAGKATSAMNALRHGILSEHAPVLPTEDRAAFQTLVEDLHAHLAPIGPIETELVARIAGLIWRLRRCAVVEVGFFAWHQAEMAAQKADETCTRATTAVYSMMSPVFKIIDVDLYSDGEEALQEAQAAQRTPAALLALAFRNDATAFATLSRYEAMLDARLAHALATLDRLQTARRLPVVTSARMVLAAKRSHD
jgi:hypothetical protein